MYYQAQDRTKLVAALTKRLGPPNGTNPDKPSWQGDKSFTFVETEHNWYSLTENALSKDAQAWFLAHLAQAPGSTSSGATTPAATKPAAPATPAAKAATQTTR